jgi:hypothetical protein
MSRHPELYSWRQQIASHLPLSQALVGLLALWSLGMILARRCGLSSVCLFLHRLLGPSTNTLRQRLREFYQEAPAKTGTKQGRHRRDFQVSDCFAPLLAWILSCWTCKRLVLALDPTNLGNRFHVLCVSVVYRGLGIPVAWKILLGNQKDAWNPHWRDLLQRLHAALGPEWEVLVLSDRGLESPTLYQQILAVGAHPLMRVKAGGKFRPEGWHHFYCFGDFAPGVGARFAMRGCAYKTSEQPLPCTLLACWLDGYDEPLLLLTELAPCAANPCWYAFRAWIEQGFKVIKREGWQWQRTRMTDPGRAERLWLALAVTTLWLVAVGGESDQSIAVETVARLAKAGKKPTGTVKGQREHRVFLDGLAVLIAALLNRTDLPPWRFDPEVWPEPWHDVSGMTEAQFCFNAFYP